MNSTSLADSSFQKLIIDRWGGPWAALVAAMLILTSLGCSNDNAGAAGKVTLYCSLDQVFSEGLVRKFEEETGIEVDAVYDTEATKSVGLTGRIIEEASNPRCDVFWNNEIMNTLRLKRKGLLQSYDSPSAAGIPKEFRDSENMWTGFAARARVFIVNTDLMGEERPTSMWDYLDPKYKGKCGIAKPLFGTTATHMTALYDIIGEEETNRFLDGLEKNEVSVQTGNAHLMRQVREGKLHWGFTDTDDFNVARVENFPVDIVYPDSGDDQLGTMLIPNTVAMIEGCPNPEGAKKLIDFILSEDMEARLARSRSAQIPVRDSVARPDHVKGGDSFKIMTVDFEKAAENFDARRALLEERFVK